MLAAVRGYSRLTQAFLAFLLLCCIILVASNWANLFILPIVFGAPALIAYVVYYKNLRLAEAGQQDESFWRMFAAGFLPGSLAALGIELLVSLIVGAICLGPQILSLFDTIAEKQAEDPSWVPSEEDVSLKKDGAYWLYVFLNAFLVAATVEECVKAAIVRNGLCQCCCSPDRRCCIQHPHPQPKAQAYTTVSLMLAASLGFSLAENILYVFMGGAAMGGGTGFTPEFGFKRRQHDEALLRQAAASGMPQFAILPSGVSVALGPAASSAGSPGGFGDGQGFPAGTTFASLPAPGGAPQYSLPPRTDGLSAPLAATGPIQAVPVSSLIQSLYTQPGGAQGQGQGQGGTVGVGIPVAPPPTGHARTEGSGSGAAAGPAVDPSSIKVWSWPRVLWPAILIHGTYDWVAMLLSEMGEEAEVAALVLTLLFATVIVVASTWALRSQFIACFDAIAEGATPVNMTCAPIWWPARLRTCAARVCGVSLPETGWPMGASGGRAFAFGSASAAAARGGAGPSLRQAYTDEARQGFGAVSMGGTGSAAAEGLAYAPAVGPARAAAGQAEGEAEEDHVALIATKD